MLKPKDIATIKMGKIRTKRTRNKCPVVVSSIFYNSIFDSDSERCQPLKYRVRRRPGEMSLPPTCPEEINELTPTEINAEKQKKYSTTKECKKMAINIWFVICAQGERKLKIKKKRNSISTIIVLLYACARAAVSNFTFVCT